MRTVLRQRRQRYDEWEMRLQMIHQFLVGGHELAPLVLGQGDIGAIINADAKP